MKRKVYQKTSWNCPFKLMPECYVIDPVGIGILCIKLLPVCYASEVACIFYI
jgi:hypothetical protein